jgi:hypothetical protein
MEMDPNLQFCAVKGKFVPSASGSQPAPAATFSPAEVELDRLREFTGYLRDFRKVCPVRRQKSARLSAFPR